jgi:alkylhydroperoxidase family enzyme
MARIPYPDKESLPSEVGAVLDQMPPSAPIDMVAHSPAIALALLRTTQAQFTSLEVSERDREIVILTVATLTECEYEWTKHVAMSEAVGVSPAARESIRSRHFGADTLTRRDRLIITFVKDVIATPRVTDRVFAEVREAYTPRQIVELIRLVGFYWAFARFCTTLDVELDTEEPGDLGAFSAVSHMDIS